MRGKPDGIGVESSLSTPPLEVWKLFASELLKRGRNMENFATVSGKAGTEAEFLYRSHGCWKGYLAYSQVGFSISRGIYIKIS